MKRPQILLTAAGTICLLFVVLVALALHYVRNVDNSEDVEAIDAAKNALAENQQSPEELNRAIISEKTKTITKSLISGNLDEACQAFENHVSSIRRSPGDLGHELIESLLPYGDCLRLMGDREHKRDLYEKADGIYREAESIYKAIRWPDPHLLGEIYIRLGIIRTSLGDYQNDWVYYQRALAQHDSARDNNKSGIATAYVWLGNSFFKQGKWAKSVSNYRKATILAPELPLNEQKVYPGVYAHIGMAKINQGLYDQAEKELKVSEALAHQHLPDDDPIYTSIRQVKEHLSRLRQEHRKSGLKH